MMPKLRTSHFALLTLHSGFTLVELIVTIGIFTAVTAVVVANFPSLNSKLGIDLLGHDIAISIRQAQSYAISVRTPVNRTFDVGYGMHFEKSADPVINKQFIFFADVNNDKIYTPGTDNAVQTYTMEGPYGIENICSRKGVLTCGHTKLDISYKRPNPEANIVVNGDAANLQDEAQVCVTSANGAGRRKVRVWITGQIGVSDEPCQ